MTNFKDTEEIIKEIKNLKNGNVFKFRIMVNASSKSNSIEFKDEIIKIRIKEKPVEGKANKAIIEYLSDLLGVPKTRIDITSGNTSRIKTVSIKN